MVTNVCDNLFSDCWKKSNELIFKSLKISCYFYVEVGVLKFSC